MNFKKNKITFRRGKEVIQKIPFLAPEKKLALYVVAVILVGAAIFGILKLNGSFMVHIPVHGGTLVEGEVGLPRFINPVLASTPTDKDLTELVYSGLLKVSPEGKYVPLLASDYSISDDGLTYTVDLKKNVTWQDGKPFTADDVIFTINKIQDPKLNSPLAADWVGVDVQKLGAYKVSFHLREPYEPFLENLTVGLLPEHLWQGKSPQEFLFSVYNTHPVGTGPYQFNSARFESSGVPSEYTLESFANFALGKPYIDKIVMRFYADTSSLEGALRGGAIESAAAIDPENAKVLAANGQRFITTPLLRIFGVFWNHNKNDILADGAVREALSVGANKNEIVNKALLGYATVIDGPLPPDTPGYEPLVASTSTEQENIEAARSILENDGWTFDDAKKVYTKGTGDDEKSLAFTLTTGTAPELESAAKILKENWSAIGADVTLLFKDSANLNEDVIRPRNYQALLFGEVIGRDPDLYAFWHSSERLDPGLNIALYTNAKADALLEEARQTENRAERGKKEQAITDILQKDHPAVFLYSPEFLYAVPKDLQGIHFTSLADASDRFSNVRDWYLETEHVWRIFAPKNTSE